MRALSSHHISRRTALAGALAGAVTTSCAPNSSDSKATFAIEGATVFDGERSLGRANVLVAGAWISEVGPDVTIPSGVQVHDGAGKTVLPGLIDCHVHAQGKGTDGPRFGVTSELGMFEFFETIGTYRQKRESTATARESDLWTAGILATAPGGHGTQFGPVPTIPPDAGKHAIKEFVDKRFEEGSDYLKVIMEDGGLYGGKGPSLTPEQVGLLIDEAHRHDKLCLVHVAQARDAEIALESGADGLAHVPGDPITDRIIDLAQRGDRFVTATLSVYNSLSCAGSAQELEQDPLVGPLLTAEQRKYLNMDFGICFPGIFSAATDNVRALHEAGVTVLAGTDVANGGIARGASMLSELGLLTQAGMTPVDALRAATGSPATRFSLRQRGRVAPDHRADLVLVNGDATKEISAVRDIQRVWRNGHPVNRQP